MIHKQMVGSPAPQNLFKSYGKQLFKKFCQIIGFLNITYSSTS